MKRLLAFLLFGLWIAAAGYAQTITASLEGVVKDETGGVVPGATVRVLNTATNVPVETITGENGRFLAPEQPH